MLNLTLSGIFSDVRLVHEAACASPAHALYLKDVAFVILDLIAAAEVRIYALVRFAEIMPTQSIRHSRTSRTRTNTSTAWSMTLLVSLL